VHSTGCGFEACGAGRPGDAATAALEEYLALTCSMLYQLVPDAAGGSHRMSESGLPHCSQWRSAIWAAGAQQGHGRAREHTIEGAPELRKLEGRQTAGRLTIVHFAAECEFAAAGADETRRRSDGFVGCLGHRRAAVAASCGACRYELYCMSATTVGSVAFLRRLRRLLSFLQSRRCAVGDWACPVSVNFDAC